jgi:hypothetical protein
MLTQSKTYKQAEIDSACELIDFLRYNAFCLRQLYCEQPNSTKDVWNRTEYRPLEGFIFAITPFNFNSKQFAWCSGDRREHCGMEACIKYGFFCLRCDALAESQSSKGIFGIIDKFSKETKKFLNYFSN